MGKDQELLEAARTGNVALVEKLLSGRKGGILGSGSGAIPLSSLLSIWRGPNINCTDSSGYTALHHAALNGHKDIVLKLLQYEASTNVADNKGYFPIHLAAWRGDVDIVKILIHHGPSHSRVNEQNNENETALHCAAQYGHSEVVAVLLEELTDPTIRNNKLETPLDLAALYGRLRVVKMIIKAYPNLMNCNTRKHTPLHLAARNGHKAVVQVLLEAGMDVSCQTEKGSALHEAALFGKVEVVRILLETGIDTNIKDSLGRTVLDILKEHPSQQSLQIAALLQEYMETGNASVSEERPLECAEHQSCILSPEVPPSPKAKSEAVTGELSKLLDEIKLCQEKEYSFEDLSHTISDHYLDNFSKISEEELMTSGSQTKLNVRPASTCLSTREEEEDDVGENTCGPSGIWEALTPCNGCRNLGFPMLAQESYSKKRGYALETIPSAPLDAVPSENDNSLCDSVDIAVTKKPCSLEIARVPSSRPDNAPQVAITAPGSGNHRNSSTGPTPDCSPPSPDTALKNIVKVIRPQPKQRTSIVSSLEFHRTNHSHDYFEINSSIACTSFISTPAISPPNYSFGSLEDSVEERELTERLCHGETSTESELPEGHPAEQFAGLLHGSSPACDPPDNPLQLYSKINQCSSPLEKNILSKSTVQQIQLQKENNPDPPVKKKKPQVVNRTIFHTKTKPVENHTLVGTSTRISEQWVITTGGFVERACTLGRIRSLPKTLLEMHLYKNVSKSDSNLITHPPSDKKARSNWSEPTPNQQCSKGNSERTPSFTSEWEEIDKIMSSIDAGINTGLGEMNDHATRPRCPVQTVGQWLENIGLPQYENHLLANGFDNVQFMGSNVMEDQDLLEIGILNSGHRQRILQAIQLLPKMKQIGHDGYNPTSVAEWLDSIELGDYTKSFLINGYTSMDLVKKIWEIELINVLKISLIGHRKRVLASLGDRLHEDPPQKPPRSITLREPSGNHTPPQLSPSLSQSTFTTGGSLDVPHIIMQGDARRRRNENYFDDIPRSKLERQMAQSSVCEIWTNQNAGYPFSSIHQVHNTGDWGEPSITLRPPNEATASTPVQYWQHHPEKLIFQSCDYKAFYLGSMLVKELRGTESTQDACAKMRKSTEQMKKVPTIVLSVSYKGVKFIDATNKNIIAEHEIRNISCAAQDPEDLSTFAYITKDLKTNHHYCHVFTAFDVNLAYEIILTLGQAFEVAYQLALQARKGGHSSTLPESFENKPSKPIPKPRVSIRKSVQIDPSEQKTLANLPWIVEPGQEAKRGINTKYETTIF
ncbi:ankyrin repeat and sterile alpha motif domain-containing protein 1B isoform X2 [Anas platyrhynchos]|uniref:ankyrin repeat and sterile alpha motif domain-containing protein 1B isoform X2 n=1 Tax=Anas platyrhynchos TaxID=8839 RepID=UPI000F7C2B6C|nr:ankyrin repeat and sterile alpha motif domain-containing protein 1B isoform X2 [Anas platyrhynchos]|eukprot:XP_027308297.1 LOW QUALITY PROTEIN: ankyrin repeat and sterile alpha motif domain-containing protein 1B [Anas platyrhynchos]